MTTPSACCRCVQVWDVQLTNPTRRLLSYTARLEGPPDFSLEASVVKVEPGRPTQVRGLAVFRPRHRQRPELLRQGTRHLQDALTYSM